jgi:hypothetical protein
MAGESDHVLNRGNNRSEVFMNDEKVPTRFSSMKGQLVYDRGEYLKLPFDRRILPIVSGGPGAGGCLDVW